LKLTVFLTLVLSLTATISVAECRPPAQFLSTSFEENTTNFLNYLGCLHNQQSEQIAILERDLNSGRQELSQLREAYQLLLEEIAK
jgi:hypothetical protein